MALQRADSLGQISEAGLILSTPLPQMQSPDRIRGCICPGFRPESHRILLINRILSSPFRIGEVLAPSVRTTASGIGLRQAQSTAAPTLLRQEACSRTPLLQFGRVRGRVVRSMKSGDFVRVVTDELPIDSFRNFDGPKLAPDDDIIEFLMRFGWPEDFPGYQTTAVKPFVFIRDQSFSLDPYEAGASTVKVNRHPRSTGIIEAKPEWKPNACIRADRAKADLRNFRFHSRGKANRRQTRRQLPNPAADI